MPCKALGGLENTNTIIPKKQVTNLYICNQADKNYPNACCHIFFYNRLLLHSHTNYINMLTAIHPKLPMRNMDATKEFYIDKLGFIQTGGDYDGYLMVKKDHIEIHFFAFAEIDPKDNYSGIYIRTDNIDAFYQSLLEKNVTIHPNGPLENKPWRQREFALLDPDNNLLTFGQSI